MPDQHEGIICIGTNWNQQDERQGRIRFQREANGILNGVAAGQVVFPSRERICRVGSRLGAR